MHAPQPHYFAAEFVNLAKVQFTPELLQFIPAELALKHQVIPIGEGPGRLIVAMSDVTDLHIIDYLCSTLNREIEVQFTDGQQLKLFVRLLYGGDHFDAPSSNN